MSDGFANPIIGGGGALVYPSIHSPNFNIGNPSASPSPSWAILKSGLAYFFGLVLSGGTITGPDYVINTAGIFIYSGAPAVGNLIGSWAGAAGNDAAWTGGAGNNYPAGFNITMGVISGTTFQGTDWIINSNGIFMYSGTPGGAGTWTDAGGGLISSALATFTVSPHAVGNLVVMHICSEGGAPPVGVTGGNCNWAMVGNSFAGTVNAGFCESVWVGTATATGAAVATVTYSGAPTAFRNAGHEFISSTGGYTFVGQNNLDSAGTNQMPAVTPTSAGQLYSCYQFNNAVTVAGATPGYVYEIDANGNGLCFDANCTAVAQAPTWGDANCAFGIAAILTAAAGPVGNLVMALVNPKGTGTDPFGNVAPFGQSMQFPVYLGPYAAVPAAVSNVAALFSQTGSVNVVDGNDGNLYSVECQTRSLAADVNISHTAMFDTGLHMPVAAKRYRISGVLYITAPAAAPGTVNFSVAGPGGATGLIAFSMMRGTVLNGTNNAPPNTAFTIGPAPLVVNNTYLVYVDGIVNFLSAGVVALEAACSAAATSFLVDRFSYLDFMPR